MKLTLPELGEDIEEATVLRLLVSEGDEVENDQGILEVETDKASLEVPASSAGVIEKFSVAEGDTVKVGQELAELREKEGGGEESDESEDSAEKANEEKEAKSAERDEEEDEDQEEDSGQGDAGDQDAEEEKPASKKESSEPESSEQEKGKSSTSENEETKSPSLPVFASPSVRAFAREIGVDLVHVEGSGPGGRISKTDVTRAARELRSQERGKAGAGSAWPPGPLPDFSRWGETERVSLSGIRKATADSMSRAWANVPHVTLFEKAEVTALEEARERYRDSVESVSGAKLTVTAMLLKIVATVIGRHPRIAASFDSKHGEVVRKSYVHLGVAVDTEKGLLVPVLRDADQLGLAELAKELGKLAEQAREGTLKREDMQGGVFTVTNLGGLGTGFFTPIVNEPEGAILGVGRAETEPIYDVESGSFQPRQRLPLSLSFDHRLIDGADGARFLHALVEAIEDPIRLALEVPGTGGN